MFIDTARVTVHAGNGGNGALSFRHEKYVDRGGPDGGDGGKGGDVVFRASQRENTLAAFRYQPLLQAQHGGNGGKRQKRGKSASNLVISVPTGTIVTRVDDGSIIADLTADGQEVVVVKGGSGGFGNAHFKTSTRQAPRIAEKGEPGEVVELRLELKLLADVGIVGLPNAGKSTLLSRVSNARPEVANYPFTTLQPHLGVVDIGKQSSLLLADIPGLIEGASSGKGLGDEFLRHVERTLILLHLIDAYAPDVQAAYKTIQKELSAYKVDLTTRPQIIALNKIDGLDDDIVADLIGQLKKIIPAGVTVFSISAASGQNVQSLLHELDRLIKAEHRRLSDLQEVSDQHEDSLPVISLSKSQIADTWQIEKTKKGYLVSGEKIERFASKTDFDSNEGVARLRDIMKKMGILHELERKKIKPGDMIKIADKGSIEY